MKAAHLINQIDDPIINCTVYLKTLFEYLGKDILGKHCYDRGVASSATKTIMPKICEKHCKI